MNPQSLNRYAYVLNNPTTLVDPLGLDSCSTANCGSSTPFGLPPGTTLISITVTGATWPSIGATYGGGGDSFGEALCGAGDCGPMPRRSFGTWKGNLLPPHPTPIITFNPGKGSLFGCAANFADQYSIAGGLHALGIGSSGGVGGFITDALGGNTFSGATNLIASFGSGSAGGHNVFYNMGLSVVAGPLQGVPGGSGPWGSSASELATGAIARGAFSAVTGAGETIQTLNGTASLASTGLEAAQFASGVGIAKFIYDAASYGVGLVHCHN